MQYKFMIGLAFILAIFSSLMTSFGMTDLFNAAGMFILALFVIIDLGRFLLFNFTVNEWTNLRKVKYFIVIILILLFGYSAVGVYSKLDSLVTAKTKEAMINLVTYNEEVDNADIKKTRSEDLAKIAQKEYEEAMEWNRNDLLNCIKRANRNANAENRCNNTKRALDNKASAALKEALNLADQKLDTISKISRNNIENKTNIASVLLTICKLSGKTCNNYDDLQFALSVVIFLIIIGTDYLQIAIVLAVNTRKNKKPNIEKQIAEKKVINEIIKAEEKIEKKEEIQPMVSVNKIDDKKNIEKNIKVEEKNIDKIKNEAKPMLKQIKSKKRPENFHNFLFTGPKPSKS